MEEVPLDLLLLLVVAAHRLLPFAEVLTPLVELPLAFDLVFASLLHLLVYLLIDLFQLLLQPLRLPLLLLLLRRHGEGAPTLLAYGLRDAGEEIIDVRDGSAGDSLLFTGLARADVALVEDGVSWAQVDQADEEPLLRRRVFVNSQGGLQIRVVLLWADVRH